MTTPFTIPEPGVEPVPGYCLSQRLGKGGFGEVWRASAPGGFQVALKFVPLDDANGAVEFRALDLIRDIRHPNLLVTFAAWQIDGWLIIAMELADRTLMDRFKEAKKQGNVGIPRDELLDYFQEAARGIDYLNEPRQLGPDAPRLAIQHRDIKPQNILLVGNGVKVADFGLARLMRQAETSHSGGMTPVYAAPEFFRGHTSSSSDQYCFAITYCKMRGGQVPFDGTLPEVMAGHLGQEPDLRMIPVTEQSVVARALAKEPRERWPSCRAFVDALVACGNLPQIRAVDSLSTATYPGVPLTKASVELPNAPLIAPAPSAPINLPPMPNNASFPTRMAFEAFGDDSKPKQRSWTIGRDTGCQLVVNHSAVSAQHCRISESAAGFFLEDLGSANGTYVNGHRITGAVHVIASDQITLGQSIAMPWPSVEKSLPDARTLYIGRDPENDIVLDYATVSSRHARVVIGPGHASIEDLDSTNGVAIGKPNAKIRQAPLHPDDVVYFGSLPMLASKLLQGGRVKSGELQTLTFRGQPIVIGRDSSCDLVLDFPTVSGRHARLWQEGKLVMIEDLGSTNGTFVNGKRVHLSTEVNRRDVIGLGSFLLELDVS